MNIPLVIAKLPDGTCHIGVEAWCIKAENCLERLDSMHHGTETLHAKFREWVKLGLVARFTVGDGKKVLTYQDGPLCWREPDPDVVERFDKRAKSFLKRRRKTKIGEFTYEGKHHWIKTESIPADYGGESDK